MFAYDSPFKVLYKKKNKQGPGVIAEPYLRHPPPPRSRLAMTFF